MAKHTLENKAQAVAEYWLTGSQRRAAEAVGVGSHHTVGEWVAAAEAPKTAQHKKMRARAEEIHEQRQTSLDVLYQRALDLQLRDLAGADFRDRTGLIKIVGEQMLLQKGKPTSIEERRSSDRLDQELAELLERAAANGHGG